MADVILPQLTIMVLKVILQTFTNRGRSKKYIAVCQEPLSVQCSNSVVYLATLTRFLTIPPPYPVEASKPLLIQPLVDTVAILLGPR